MKLNIFFLYLAIAAATAEDSLPKILQIHSTTEAERKAAFTGMIKNYFNHVRVPHDDPKEIEKICKSDTDSYKSAVGASSKLKQCLNKIGSKEKFLHDLTAGLSDKNFNGFLEEYCPKSTEFSTCFESYLGEVRPCVVPSVNEYDQVGWRHLKGTVEFACAEKSTLGPLLNFETGFEFANNHSEDFKSCSKLKGLDETKTSVSDNGTSLKDRVCRDKETTYSCLKKALEKSNETKSVQLLGSLYDHVSKNLECNDKKN